MPTGIDSFTPVPAEVVRAAGHSFIARYLTDLDTSHKAKAWTVAQVAACRAAGLGVVAVWEGGGSDRTVAWRGGYDRGRRDARLAAQQAGAL
ncbi:glycoside hydrolase domain-containing protein, partial [Embleya sp. NPDC001921]